MVMKKGIALFMVLAFIITTVFATVSAETTQNYGQHYTLYGDLTLDETINAKDALEVLKLVVGKSQNDRVLPAADVNRDGAVDAKDALEILKHTVGKTTKLNTPEQVTIHLWSQWQTVRTANETQDGLEVRTCNHENCTAREERTVAYVPPATDYSQMQQEVLRSVNQERSKKGLQPLSYYTPGQYAGDIRAEELNTLFSHTRPNGSDCFSVIEKDVNWFSLGENIAMGQTSPSEVMNSWMNSSAHRDNILNPNFTHLIVGVVECKSNGYSGYCWVQLFIQL